MSFCAKTSMRQLRQERRRKGLCAQCGTASSQYLCQRCKAMRRKPEPKGFREYPIQRKLKSSLNDKRLYEDMIRLKLRTADIAQYCGVTQRTAEKWVFEGSVPNPERVVKLCELMGREVGYYYPLYKWTNK
ncbi:helix-turn-helix domain-containing protein [Paenibacillus dendritiformis]|uniref:helix-turn-helix domain-containing protein n=1 Tax=Paenibacillus dendritiformis TaxID=130049 RepID=UPI0011B73519|nr:helix-turn-helix transcriptional regulator [Paenibacillus dendritiformis]